MSEYNKIHDKLDDQTDRLARIETNLAEHMRRTSLLETQVATLSKWQWSVAGGLAVLTFIAQFIIKKL